MSVIQVAASNRWYSEFTDDSKDQFHTNLEWTRVYFVNNVDSLTTIINAMVEKNRTDHSFTCC
jgi:hypothetical protein